VILIARRGWTARVAAMGVSLATRHGGLGRQMLVEAIAAARTRGERQMLLEVFAQNERAVGLYTQAGFARLRRLVGYRRDAQAPEAEALTEIDPLEFARIVAREGDANLPWQLTAETLAASTSPARVYGLGGCAWASVTEPAPGEAVLTLRALVVERAARRKGWGRRLIAALAARHPAWALQVLPVVPEDLAPGFFAATGFEATPLYQYEMRRALDD
jgi:GNAT superfamily N-acetyltransferase